MATEGGRDPPMLNGAIKPFQKNCPIIERDGDGRSVGRCWFHTGKNGICPRHGDVKEYLARLPELTDERELKNIRSGRK